MNERSPEERGGQVARDWVSVLTGPSGVVMTPEELADLLGALAADVLALAPGHPVQPERAAKIGAALVDASLVHPEVLGRSLTVIARHLDPGPGPAASAATAVLEAITSGYVRALRDRTLADAQRSADEARRRAEAKFRAQLKHQAQYDPLTGVANRACFLDRLAAAMAAPAGRIGLAYLDLDGFTSVNDTLGHDIGDELLVAVARRLQDRIEPVHGLVARMGGDEFSLLVENTGGLDAMVALASDVLSRI